MPTYNIQPDETASQDTWINSNAPNNNFDGQATLEVGWFTTPQTRRSLIKFDLSVIPSGEEVTAADLVLEVADGGLAANAATLEAYRVLRAWTEGGVTWNTYDGTNNWGTAGCDNTTSDRDATAAGTVAVGVTPATNSIITLPLSASIVQGWHATPASNHGLLLKVQTEGSVANLVGYIDSGAATSTQRPELIITTSEAPSGQVLRPDADVADAGWLNEADSSSPLHTKLADESDATYIYSPLAPSGQACIVSLESGVDPEVHTGHAVTYRYAKDAADGEQINLLVSLYQSTTLIAEQTHTDIPATITEGTLTVTEGEAATITDYTALELRFAATQV